MTTSIETELARRTVYLQRFAAYLVNQYFVAGSQQLAKDLPKLMSDFAEVESLTRRERDKLRKDFTKSLAEKWQAIYADLAPELEEMARLEQQAVSEIYSAVGGVELIEVAQDKVTAYINSATMILTSGSSVTAGTWAELYLASSESLARRVDGLIQQGFRDGWTYSQYLQAMRGTYNKSTKQYAGGQLTGVEVRYADSLIRTGVMHYSNQATLKMFADNKDVISGVEFVATLDNRVTALCASLDGTIYPIGKVKNIPPLHPRCRSRLIGVGDGISNGRYRPAVGGKATDIEAYKNKPKYTGKKSLDVYSVEQIGVKADAEQWLREQPLAWLESSQAFGKTTAKLFKEGKLTLAEMMHSASNRPLTLAEIKAIKPELFRGED